MKPLKSEREIRDELRELIAEAVAEVDLGRRGAILTLADHWAEILCRRRAQAIEAAGHEQPAGT